MQRLWESVDRTRPLVARGWFPYGLAILGSVLALLATELSTALFGVHLPFLLGLGVVLVCAVTGGLLPGCLATICSVVLADISNNGALPLANVLAIVVFSVLVSIGGEVILRLKDEAQTETWRVAERERFLRDFFHTLPAPVAVINADGVILASNRSAATLFKSVPAAINGRSITDLICMNDLPMTSMPSRLPHYREYDDHITGRAMDGSDLDLAVHMSDTVAGKQSVRTLYLRDETTTRRVAQQHALLMAEVERLGRAIALGQLGGAIAHELNQPLTSAANYASAARGLLSNGRSRIDVDAVLGDALKQIFRASKVLRRLRRFVEAQPPEMEWLDIQQVIEEAVSLGGIAVRNAMGTMSVEIDANVGAVLVDRIQIQQVLLNLIINASEAIANTTVRKIQLSVAASSPDSLASVRVHDTGSGVSADMTETLFRPFSTSKSNGLGVGLSISKSIVEAHGGSLWYEPAPGGGATFGFTLQHRAGEALSDVA